MGVLVLGKKKRIVGSNRQLPCQKLISRPLSTPSAQMGRQPRNTRRPHTCSVRSARQRDLISAYFRLSPNSGARADIPGPPLWAKTSCKQVQQTAPYSIISSASKMNDSGIVSPSAFAVLRLTTSSNLL